ncbi:Transposase IS605 OrfB [Geitlerinema sp. FC II]|nr:Transposase IS605 OrfB [Geitlerinema sp. FC II]PPT09327.1 Transposase IS605 OrfB [Geitlerinema sp. FC II]PPT10926.1 Transposase IS605 OrfB [Geitlerinema sp. FC II]PPT11115.1 Transposase IS605 OrfB [Geitlerinema sp. FC II]
MQTTALFTASEMKQISGFLTLIATFNEPVLSADIRFAIAVSVRLSNETTWIDKLLICKASTRKPKSLKRSPAVSTSNEKGLKPYWNDLCVEISSRLWLPVETDSLGSPSSLSNTWSNSTVEKSWFSATLKVAQNPNSPPIFSPSFMSSVAEFTDSASTARKSKKIQIYLTAEQRHLARQWFGVSRFVYNRTIEYLQTDGTQANWKAIKTDLLNSLPEFCKAVPYQIKSIAIKDACTAVREAKKKFKKTGQIQKPKFRTRRDPVQSCYIPKSAVSEVGVYRTILGSVRFAESLPKKFGDCRMSMAYGRFYLCVPEEAVRQSAVERRERTRTKRIAVSQPENQGRVIAIDPGVRTFATFFSEQSFGKIGEGDFSRIQRLCHHLDDLISRSSKASSSAKRRLRKAASRMRLKIRNLIDELHHKTARFLVDNFDVILLPTFETSQMSKRSQRQIRSKTVRSMLSFSHYRFKQFLKYKAFETGKLVLDVCEAYTSKTVSWTGELLNIGGAKQIKSRIDSQVMDRDINGARGIFLRALVDTPWMRQHLAFVNER